MNNKMTIAGIQFKKMADCVEVTLPNGDIKELRNMQTSEEAFKTIAKTFPQILGDVEIRENLTIVGNTAIEKKENHIGVLMSDGEAFKVTPEAGQTLDEGYKAVIQLFQTRLVEKIQEKRFMSRELPHFIS